MTRKILFLVVAAALLAGCAGYTERTSPCVCDWRPINATLPGETVAV